MSDESETEVDPLGPALRAYRGPSFFGSLIYRQVLGRGRWLLVAVDLLAHLLRGRVHIRIHTSLDHTGGPKRWEEGKIMYLVCFFVFTSCCRSSFTEAFRPTPIIARRQAYEQQRLP